VVRISRLSAALARDAVGEAIAARAGNGYAVTAVVVTVDGVRQAVLRGDGAPVHTRDGAYAKACSGIAGAGAQEDQHEAIVRTSQ
jgi:uncharacterized protein GlcG (DUF336 family)